MQLDTTTLVLIAALVLGVTFGFYYLIIKAAVKAANKDLIRQIKSLKALKVIELKNKGIHLEEIKQAGGFYREMAIIEHNRHEMTNDDYMTAKKKLEQLYE